MDWAEVLAFAKKRVAEIDKAIAERTNEKVNWKLLLQAVEKVKHRLPEQKRDK